MGAPGGLIALLLIKDGAISQALVWGPQNTKILMRFVIAAGFVTPKEIQVNHRKRKVQFSNTGEPDS